MAFGIPQYEEAASILEGAITDNQTDLNPVIAQNVGNIGQIIRDNRSELNVTNGRNKRVLGNAVAANNKDLDTVGHQIDLHMVGTLEANATDMPESILAAGHLFDEPQTTATMREAGGQQAGGSAYSPPVHQRSQYWATVHEDTHTCTVSPVQAMSTPGNVVTGPFPSEESALAWCAANRQSSPPHIWTEPQPPGLTYSCYRSDAHPESPGIVVRSDGTPPQFWHYHSGPYTTPGEAYAICGTQLPPQPQPPTRPGTQPPTTPPTTQQLPGPIIGGWYILRYPNGEEKEWFSDGTLPPGTSIIAGPFNSVDELRNRQNFTRPPVDATGKPWWCVQWWWNTGGGAQGAVMTLADYVALQSNPNLHHISYATGFQTQAEAEAYCNPSPTDQMRPPTIPPTTIGQPPTPPTPTDIPEPVSVCLKDRIFPAPPACDKFPSPGTQEWCDGQDAIIQGLAAIGNGILDTVDRMLDPELVFGPDIQVGGILGSLSIGGQLLKFWHQIEQSFQCVGKVVFQMLREAFRWIRSLANCTLPCDPSTVLGLRVVHMFLRILKNTRLGTDAGAWATLDMEFTIPAIEIAVNYLVNASCPIIIPSIFDAIECYLTGTITESMCRCWVLMQGGNWEVWKQVAESRRDRLQVKEMIEYSRRQGWGDFQLFDELKALGYTRQEDIDRRIEMYDEIPSISDHMQWMRKNVFDDKYVKDYQLLEGFDDRFWTKFGNDLRAKGMLEKNAALHYAAHWTMPSPEQMKQFVYRLRPDRVPPNLVFTANDYKRILQEQDYNVLAREWFAATINPVPAISYVKQMFQLGAINAVQLKAYHMDLGYKDEDADNFVKVDTIQRNRLLASSGHGFNPTAIAKAYNLGKMDADEVKRRMTELGYTPEIADDLMRRSSIDQDAMVIMRARSRVLGQLTTEVKNAVTIGTMSVDDADLMLRQAGFPSEQSHAIASHADAAAKDALVKQAIARLRSAYIQGEIDAQFAQSQLKSLGIVDGRSSQYMSLWRIQQTPGRKRRTATQIVSDVSTGMLTVADALTRLYNLGYNNADSMLFLADANRKIVSTESKASAAGLRSSQRQGKELARLAKESERQKRQIVSDLRRMEPPSKVQKWLRLKLIDESTFANRMRLYGYGPAEIDLWIAEALAGKPTRNGQGNPK